MKKYVFMFLLSLTSMVSMARDSIVTAQQRCQIEAMDKAELLVPLTPSYLDGITSTTGWDNNWFVEAKGGTSAFIGTPIGVETFSTVLCRCCKSVLVSGSLLPSVAELVIKGLNSRTQTYSL